MASLPTSPIAGVNFPITDLTSSALAYVQEHNTPTVANHVLRSTLFALIIARKVPPFASCDAESIFLATILHDLGWSSTPSLISKDKRFEVDSANAARDFIHSHDQGNDTKWTEQRLQLIWDAVSCPFPSNDPSAIAGGDSISVRICFLPCTCRKYKATLFSPDDCALRLPLSELLLLPLICADTDH